MLQGFKLFVEDGEARVYNSFSQNTVGRHNDASTAKMLPSTWTGSEDLGKYFQGVPGVDLEVPTVSRTSIVKSVEKRRNPIRVELMDGTVMQLTLDEFNRIDTRTKLYPGREVTVTFQRLEGDSSQQPSKVVSVS
jgi:hypothetical protein